MSINKQFKHDFAHGDFVRIDNVEGMKEVNGDARPVKIVDDYSFTIENTSNYGKYEGKGVASKVKITAKIPFSDIKTQILFNELKDPHLANLSLATSTILSFFVTNNRLPAFFSDSDENEAMGTAQVINKGKVEVDENLLRSIFKTCSYSFYPLIHLLASIVAMECVKKTGRLEPIVTPYFVDWYDKVPFENKKSLEKGHLNIIAHDVLEKVIKMQMGIVDEGATTRELFCLLYSCQIA